MRPDIRHKLQEARERHEELALLLSDPDVISDQKRYQQLSREYASLEPLVTAFAQHCAAEQEIAEARDMLSEPDMRELAEESMQEAQQRLQEVEKELQWLLLPKDPNDERNLFLEIRAGTGGDEAAIFAGDLFRMYSRYADSKGWKVEIISANAGEHGGFREIISRIEGAGAYSRLKFESGTHRVQRVPATESQGRVHTSACTVAVLPEVDDVTEYAINPADLRIDTFRSSGAGGQHVNTTDSAIRITHLPTGVVVECQDERSQHKNKAKAMNLLRSRLLEAEREKIQSEQSETRKLQVGSGDRSQRIRTYNYPQGRLTDHRINLTLYKLPEILQGQLDSVIEPLMQKHQADLLGQPDTDEA